MVELLPLRGLRFDPRRVGDLGAVLAPPFDQISEADQAALYDRSPWNVVRLERSRAEPGDDESRNGYTRAAETLREWTREGVLRRDSAPRLYFLEQEFAHGGRRLLRRSLFGRVRLEPWEKAVVRPHETTLSKPREDRLRLLRALRVQVSPVFSLFADDGGEIGRVVAGATGSALAETIDAAGDRHRLSAIDDPKAHASLERLFAGKTVTIADGHHRYETGLAFLGERREGAPAWTGGEPENFVMMGLAAVDDPGLVVRPFHRIVKRALPPDFRERLSRSFRVEECRVSSAPELLSRLAAERLAAPVFGLWDGAGFALLHPSGKSPDSRLDVDLLHRHLLEPILGITPEDVARGGAVEFTMDGEKAVGAVRSGRGAAAFLLHPTPAREVLLAADEGRRMPPKSTAFFPKLPTGLVLHPLDGAS
jgi:uncharacterized protein (DUF1015 family)